MEAGLALALMIFGDPAYRPCQSLPERGRDAAESALPRPRVELPRLRWQIQTVELKGVLADRLIPADKDVLEDFCYQPAGLRVGTGRPREERLEGLERWYRKPADQAPPSLGSGLATRL